MPSGLVLDRRFASWSAYAVAVACALGTTASYLVTVGLYCPRFDIEMTECSVRLWFKSARAESSIDHTVFVTPRSWRKVTWMPEWIRIRTSGILYVRVPIWWVTVPLLLICGWVVLKPRNQLRLGACRMCGYNLTGNVSGICPECGHHCQRTAGDHGIRS